VAVFNDDRACTVVVGGEVDSYTISRRSRGGGVETARDSSMAASGVNSMRREKGGGGN
jgi:hypothetical protein